MKLSAEQLKPSTNKATSSSPIASRKKRSRCCASEADNILKLDRQEVWREKSGAPRTAFAAHKFNKVFEVHVAPPAPGRASEAIVRREVYVHQFKLNAKAAFEGDVWQWHQDYGTWQRDDGMPEPRAMNIAIFLDEVLPINGALMIIPKSHKQGVFAAGHDKTTTSYPLWTLDKETVTRLAAEAAGPDGVGIVAPTGKPGSVLMFHGNLVHASPPNITPYPRKIVYLTLCACLQPHHQVHAAGMDRASRLHADRAGRRRRADRIRPRAPGRGGINFSVSAHLTRRACCNAHKFWQCIAATATLPAYVIARASRIRIRRDGERSRAFAMYTLYSMQRSGNSYKVRLALARLGIPYKLVEVDILQGESRTPEFLAKNPNGQIPLLEVAPDRYLAELNAILWYVAGGTTLAPEDRIERAEALQWMFFEQHSLEPNIGAAYFWLALDQGRPRLAEPRARGLDGKRLSRARRHGDAPRQPPLFRRQPFHHRRHRALRLHPRRRTSATSTSRGFRRSATGSTASPRSPATSRWTGSRNRSPPPCSTGFSRLY